MLPAIDALAGPAADEMKLVGTIAMKEWMAVDPEVALLVYLAEGVEVELTDQRCETLMTEVRWKSFALQFFQILNLERIARWQPLLQM